MNSKLFNIKLYWVIVAEYHLDSITIQYKV